MSASEPGAARSHVFGGELTPDELRRCVHAAAGLAGFLTWPEDRPYPAWMVKAARARAMELHLRLRGAELAADEMHREAEAIAREEADRG